MRAIYCGVGTLAHASTGRKRVVTFHPSLFGEFAPPTRLSFAIVLSLRVRLLIAIASLPGIADRQKTFCIPVARKPRGSEVQMTD